MDFEKPKAPAKKPEAPEAKKGEKHFTVERKKLPTAPEVQARGDFIEVEDHRGEKHRFPTDRIEKVPKEPVPEPKVTRRPTLFGGNQGEPGNPDAEKDSAGMKGGRVSNKETRT